MKGRITQFVINYLTRHLLHTVTEDDILQIANREYLYKNRKLNPEEIEMLKNEARALSESFLWKLMVKEAEYMAFISMTSHAKTSQDITWGKAIFYSVDLMKKFLAGLKA